LGTIFYLFLTTLLFNCLAKIAFTRAVILYLTQMNL